MARITFSPLIAGASGKAADCVFSNWKGRAYIRKLVVPKNPQSAAQTAVRESMARSVELFRSLALSIKAWLNTQGVERTISGYNLFVKNNRALEQASGCLIPTPPNPYCAAPLDFDAIINAADGSQLNIHWTDNSPTVFAKIHVFARDRSGNVFSCDEDGLDASAEGWVASGLASGTAYQYFGAFKKDGLDEYGSSACYETTTA